MFALQALDISLQLSMNELFTYAEWLGVAPSTLIDLELAYVTKTMLF